MPLIYVNVIDVLVENYIKTKSKSLSHDIKIYVKRYNCDRNVFTLIQ